jgi:hypothetical protein
MSLYGRKSEEYEAVAGPPELSHALPSLKEIGKPYHNWQSNEIQQQLPTEILLITTNDHEFRACYSFMNLKNVIRSWDKSLGMVDFGKFGDAVKVTLISCQPGPTAAVKAVKHAADILKPKAILSVGICGTMNPAKAKLGDVVISAKLATYADKKVKEDGTMEHRGIKANVSPKMSGLILSAAQGWQPPLKDVNSLGVEVHRDGVMLSGPELVNNLVRRQELAADFPDALGLEMEGAGKSKPQGLKSVKP